MRALALVLALCGCAAALHGCSLFTRGLHTVEDLAYAACVLTFGDPNLEPALAQKLGSSTPEDFCKIVEVVKPFLAQQKAGLSAAKASLVRPH